jgi:hypothetical protein
LAISVTAIALTYFGLAVAQSTKPLNEQGIVKLIELQLGDDAIVAKLQKDGVDFVVDDAAVDRLKKAGASDAVIESVRKAGQKKPAAAKAVTYADVLNLLQLGMKESDIIERLGKSPTIFTLGEAQVDELKKAGATDALLAAMQEKRVAPNVISEITDFAIILDCSGSMAEKTKEGPTKMTVAKRVVTELIQKIPDGLNLSFIIYGHDKNLRCQAVKVVRPMKALDSAGKEELARVIARLQPVGATPIALALEAAGTELARNNSPSGLVLISDGKETCNGDPAATAAKLAANPNLTFGVNVIGFDVQDDEREALAEIAKAGKGEYYNAENATQFREVVQALHKHLDVVVKPVAPPKVSLPGRRAVKVLKPQIELPPMKKMALIKAGSDLMRYNYYSPMAEVTKYDQEMRLLTEDAYDVLWQPADGLDVRMIRGLAVKGRKVLEVKPEDYLGMVRVAGTGLSKPRFLSLTAVGAESPEGSHFNPVQWCKGFGVIMVVPAGEYDLWCTPDSGATSSLLEKKLKVKPGEVTELD